ncbi:hypothetical protein GCM10017752_07510 [Streptomyces roseoviridis]
MTDGDQADDDRTDGDQADGDRTDGDQADGDRTHDDQTDDVGDVVTVGSGRRRGSATRGRHGTAGDWRV